MKLEKFKEKNNKRTGIIVFTLTCILLVSGIILYRTFAIFEVKTNQNVIKGTVQDPGNLYFAFYQKNEESGEYEIQKDMPNFDNGLVLDEESSYCGVNGEKNDKITVSLTEDWRILVSGVTTSRTKCNLYFTKGILIMGHGIPVVASGEGLYNVEHTDLENDWKTKEHRYAGSNPNNYIWFNEELWRIIGLVNVKTSDNKIEQRIKIVRKDSIGEYSWHNIYENDWTKATLMELLNGIYYNSSSGECWNGEYAENTKPTQQTCNFIYNESNIKGLNERARNMIDENISWNLGGLKNNQETGIKNTTEDFYKAERSTEVFPGNQIEWNKINTYNSNGELKPELFHSVALLYSSDIGYAIGGNLRASCLAKGLGEDTTECKEDNWIRKNLKLEAWELTAEPDTEVAVYRHVNGRISERRGVVTSLAVYPALYLKNNVKIIDGLGTEENPYKLALIS